MHGILPISEVIRDLKASKENQIVSNNEQDPDFKDDRFSKVLNEIKKSNYHLKKSKQSKNSEKSNSKSKQYTRI